MVSSIKGTPLTPVEQVEHTFEDNILIVDGVVNMTVARAVAEAELRSHMVGVFRKRLTIDHALKHKIGGTRWSVNLRHFEVEVQEIL